MESKETSVPIFLNVRKTWFGTSVQIPVAGLPQDLLSVEMKCLQVKRIKESKMGRHHWGLTYIHIGESEKPVWICALKIKMLLVLKWFGIVSVAQIKYHQMKKTLYNYGCKSKWSLIQAWFLVFQTKINSLSQWLPNYSLWTQSSTLPVFINKIFSGLQPGSCMHIFCGCFCASTGELRSCDRDHMACKT